MKRTLLATSLVASAIALAPLAWADQNAYLDSNVYSIGQVLFAGDSVVGNSCYYHTDLQSDGNLVTYSGLGGPVFYAFPFTKPYAVGDYAIMQDDGNFVVYDINDNSVRFATNTQDEGDDAVQQDDGNFVVYAAGGGSLFGTKSSTNQPTVSPCNMHSTVWDVNNGEVVLGSEIGIYSDAPFKGYLGGGWAKCGELCNSNSSCWAFNYITDPLNDDYICTLYSSVTSGPEANANSVEGIKRVLTPSR